ncbi:flagellar hook-basal body protein [Desulfovibrio sp. X2]|uniref:flagellar hook protein FlgE n=1 Tax=Desulfovibrio sp. X2 TaxID=941449 RepID=UPI000358C172|nr:flagellar hook-basal body complex protein [Desulfovibrio sp. X2]EPR44704.1 flagellar hook-basal body protein [Desulfovibrio sp. X2]
MFGSMYVGATGAVALSNSIQVTSNNLANVNTIGFKSSRTLFQDLMYQDQPGGYKSDGGTVYGAGAVGKGVSIADIMTDFRNGPYEAGTNVTDLAIAGDGFFKVVDGQANAFYTRAGNFRFDKEGVLRLPSGMALQGYAMDQQTGATAGSTSDIHLPVVQETINGQTVSVIRSLPQATGSVTMDTNLNSGSLDRSTDTSNPFFALAKAWDGTSSPPLADESFAYRSGIQVYDANGNAHTLNVYFDPASTGVGGLGAGGTRVWEYVVGVDPSEDGRSLVDSGAKGLLMAGTLTFNAAGNLTDQTAWIMDPSASSAGNLSMWHLASLSADGHPQFDASFLSSGAAAAQQAIALDFGIASDGTGWSTSNAATAAGIGSNASNLPSMNATPSGALATTSYSSSSVTLNQNQDGYAEGYLNYLTVDSKGVIAGHFTNGQTEGIYKLALYDFTNDYGLRHEGGNLFSATKESGAAIEGAAGEKGLGTVQQSTLEQSNVDMATEFANLIVNQRGFQANTKVITTADSLISTLEQVIR